MSKYLAEAIATFALIFVGAGSVLAGVGTLGIAFAHGLVLAVMIYATAHISGAHINPAVTISMWATKRMKTPEAIKYIISQLVGAVAGAYLLAMVFVNAPASAYLGTNQLAAGVSPVNGIIIEAVLTFFLVFTIFATAVDKRNKIPHAALPIGFVLIFDHIVGLGLTGSSMNPARTFGPALVSGYWANQIVYWVGPIVGALVAAFLYSYVFLGKRK